MPLVEIEFSVNGSDLPKDVGAFVFESNARVERYVKNNPIRMSGFGVVASLAGMLGFYAYRIEIDRNL